MNRLQRLPGDTDYLVTLNATDRIDPDAIIAVMELRAPCVHAGRGGSAADLPQIATDTTVYAGAYHGWGFHEDGCRSGVAAALRLGGHW